MSLSHIRSRSPVSWPVLGTMIFARLLFNAQFRIVYPFLPAIGRGLGLPLETASLLVTVRALAGAAGPLLGYLSDRYGRWPLMLGGLLALGLGGGLVAIAPTFGLALAAFALLGLAKAAYEPAMQAYVGDVVPYRQRGRFLGLVEFSWAGSWLIGVPAAGFLIARYGWRSPFAVIALLAVFGLGLTWWLRPRRSETAGEAHAGQGSEAAAVTHPSRGWRFSGGALAAVLVSVLVVSANENMFMVYGAWLESQFGLAVATLGVVSTVVSVSELVACATSTGIVDRVGKRRALLGGLALNVAAYLLLPRFTATLPMALAAMVVLAATSEFCIVSALPLVSEVVPEARGTVMALNATLISGGVMVVSVVAPRLWEVGGLSLTTGISAGLALCAGLLLWRCVAEVGAASEARGLTQSDSSATAF